MAYAHWLGPAIVDRSEPGGERPGGVRRAISDTRPSLGMKLFSRMDAEPGQPWLHELKQREGLQNAAPLST